MLDDLARDGNDLTGMVTAIVELPADHPGFSDPDYRRRREAIAAVAGAFRPGERIPDVHYSAEEDAVWRTVSAELAAKHRRLACAEYLAGMARLDLPTDRVPQLGEVDARLQSLTGFRVRPVPGLVPTRDFYGALAERTFLSTQYIRHHSVPFYTPEPDVVHELVGHLNMLASERFADLYEKAGRASRRASSPEALEFFSKVFWFTLEFGVVHEEGALKAYGAGLLSSSGELDVFTEAEIRAWDLAAMGTQAYDITHYQPLLFEAPGMNGLMSRLGDFFDEYGEGFYRESIAYRESSAPGGRT
ncbi:MAG: phenylalanine 4-monooxygenase [Acidobacteriota bacterium]|nr:phenylalanine 4-monooxygenase [Acidobacteriota bacterium]